jgi:hypothetical protein
VSSERAGHPPPLWKQRRDDRLRQSYPPLLMYRRIKVVPAAKDRQRLGSVTREQMIQALVRFVETLCQGVDIVEAPEIRGSGASRGARSRLQV